MYYKLIKALPKHDIGELVILNEKEGSEFYEWVESPNYLLPKDVVEDSDEFFEPVFLEWVRGDKIFYLNSYGEIIEHIFNPKAHLKFVLINNAFKSKEDAEWVLFNYKKLLNDDIVITDKDLIFKAIDILNNDTKNIKSVIDILNKIIK